MAEKSNNKEGNALLKNIVSQLQQLNRANAKDLLRDAEALKRQESLAAANVVANETQGALVSDAQDFQRRFLAGQARTEFNAAIKDRPAKEFAQMMILREAEISREFLHSLDEQLIDFNKSFGLYMMDLIEILNPGHWDDSKRPQPAWRDALGGIPKSQQPGGSGYDDENLKSLPLIKVNSDKSTNTLSTIKNINHQILDFLKQSKVDGDLRWNTTQRDREEARRESIKNAGLGVGAVGGGREGGSDADEESGGIFGWLSQNSKNVGLGAGALTLWALTKKWFGFKTKRGFAKTMKLRLKIMGRKLFGRGRGARNPRMWPILLAGMIASGFINQSTEQMDDFKMDDDGGDGSEIEIGDGPAGKSILTLDNAINALLITTLLPVKSLVTRVSTLTKLGITKIFKNAGKNTLRGKMWAKMIKSGGWKMAGRGFLRFFGPWGLAAWAVSEIVIWRLDAIKAQQGENDALMQEMLDVDTEASAMDFIANTDMEKFKHLTQGPMMLADPNTKQKENVRMLLETVKKNKEAQEVYIQELMKHGWSEAELRQMQTSINTPRSQYGTNLNSLHPAADKAAAARAFEESLAFAKEYTNAAYSPGLTMNDDILYGTGVGTYGGYTDLSRGGDIITVHNSETIFINQPKENVHHLAKGPK